MKFEQQLVELTQIIKDAYESGVTIEQAERYAAQFLHAQLLIAQKLQETDLDSRMKKSGVKAIKAAVYLDEASKGDKKPSDVYIGAKVDSNQLVGSEQKAFDEAESYRDSLQNYYNIMKEAHIFFRGVSKGRFE